MSKRSEGRERRFHDAVAEDFRRYVIGELDFKSWTDAIRAKRQELATQQGPLRAACQHDNAEARDAIRKLLADRIEFLEQPEVPQYMRELICSLLSDAHLLGMFDERVEVDGLQRRVNQAKSTFAKREKLALLARDYEEALKTVEHEEAVDRARLSEHERLGSKAPRSFDAAEKAIRRYYLKKDTR